MRLGMETPTSICLWRKNAAAACVATWSVWQPWYFGTLSGCPVVVMGGAAWKLMALGSRRNIVMKMRNVVISCLSPETERKRKHFFCFSFLCFIVASIYYFFEFLLNLSVCLFFWFFFLSFRPIAYFRKRFVNIKANLNMGWVVQTEAPKEGEGRGKFSFGKVRFTFSIKTKLRVDIWGWQSDLCFQKPVCTFFFFFSDSAELKRFVFVATLEQNKVDQDCDPTHREWKVVLGGWMIQIVGKSRYELWI